MRIGHRFTTHKKGEILFTYTPLNQEQEIFVQCYLPDTPQNRNVPFFKVRHALPSFWFVSNRGYIISVNKGIILYSGQVNQKNRLQVKFQGKVLPYEAIKAICFPECLKYPEKKALKMIMEKGLKAFDSQQKIFVELHHDNRYISSKTKVDALKNLPENSMVEHLSFLTVNVHDILDSLGGEPETEDIAKKICAAVDKAGITTPIIVFPGKKKKAGKIINLIDETNNDFMYAIAPKLKHGAAFPQIVKKVLENQYNLEKRPVQLHCKINNMYYDITIFKRKEEDYRYIYKMFGLLFVINAPQKQA